MVFIDDNTLINECTICQIMAQKFVNKNM